MTTKAKFAGPPIVSIFELPLPMPVPEIDPRSVMFTSFEKAIAWRNSLTPEQAVYLASVDKSVARMIPGQEVDIRKANPADPEQFYKCLSYVFLGCNLQGSISFNSDFSVMKLQEPFNYVPERK